MRRIVLLFAILCSPGCADRPPRPGEEVIAYLPPPGAGITPGRQVIATASWDRVQRLCYLPVGTRLRIASEAMDDRYMIYVLEGEYAGQTLAISRACLRRP